jgi:hypothetical protein
MVTLKSIKNWRVFEIDKTKPLKFDSAYAANADDIGVVVRSVLKALRSPA